MMKSLKSRITSDTSEDEYNRKKAQIKMESFCDMDNSGGFMENDEKQQMANIKDEMEHLIKKERRNSKHQDFLPEVDAQMFSDISQSEIKTEKFNNLHSFADNTSDEDNHEITKKERSERKEKKHRKKQKKQKHSLSSEEASKLENTSDTIQTENTEKSKHEKRKEHSKKEKRRDKTREGRDKSKKSKKNKLENKSESKREGKMENIFGSLSEDSENGTRDIEQEQKSNTPVDDQLQITYHSESEKEPENKTKEKAEREREREEHHKKKKERKRREKERRLQKAAASAASMDQASNENSMDFADMGKQLEANMLQDESLDGPENITKDIDTSSFENTEPFQFAETTNVPDNKRDKEDRKESKEKKKKRKKSKDEKSKHHHHHHHERNKPKTPEVKKEIPSTTDNEVKVETQEPMSTPNQPQNPSLPTILDETSPACNENLTPDFSVSPMNPIISPIPKTPTTSKERKREKFLPGFGTEIDEKIHESAVKSISEFETTSKQEEVGEEENDQTEKPSPSQEEKPRVVISQEETEDAVAALLGESFGIGKQEEFYNDESSVNDPPPLVEESNVQDDEEMRQAVQSLSATDLDVKPDTPQSEHELQIDTDTEEESPARFDPPPKTPEPSETDRLPITPEIPPYFRKNMDENTSKLSPVILKNTNIGSPPSLTPIRPQTIALADVRKSLDMEQKSLPILPEQTQQTVISQSWAVEKKQDTPNPKPQASVIKIEAKKVPVPPLSEPHQHSKTKTPPPNRQYASPPPLKMADTPYPPKALSDISSRSPTADQSIKIQNVPVLQTPSKSPNPPQLHNLPARSPVQINKLQMPVNEPGLLSPKSSSGVIHSRLPITPVMASKPLQPSTVILQQSKVAHPSEPPKLVATSDHRPQDHRPRTVFQTSNIQSQQFGTFAPNPPRMMIQGNIRHLPSQGLLVPTRQLTAPHNYGFMSNIPHSSYNLPPISKENLSDDKSHIERPKLQQSFPPALSVANSQNNAMPSKIVVQQNLSLSQPLTIPKELSCLPCTPSMASPKTLTSSPSPKPFMPMCSSPKLRTPPPTSQSPKPVFAISNLSAIQTSCSSTKPAMSLPVSSSIETPSQPAPTNIIHSAPILFTLLRRILFSLSPKQNFSINPTSKHSEPNQSNVITELKTSMPSPVIVSMSMTVSTANVTEVSKPTELIISDTKTNRQLEDQPIKLAIEKVTDELNSYLEKSSPEIKEENPVKLEDKPKVILEEKCDVEPEAKPDLKKLETEHIVESKNEIVQEDIEQTSHTEKEDIIPDKEIEKFDEEKTETESIISNISKERSASADILAKDDPLDTKEDSDYWSAKEVNIDSVIKTLCSADELSDHSSENGKVGKRHNESSLKDLESEKKIEPPTENKNDEFIESKNDISMDSKKDTSMEIKNDTSVESRNDESLENRDESIVNKNDESFENKGDVSVEEKTDEPEAQDETVEPEESKGTLTSRAANTRGRGGRGRGRGKARGGVDSGGIQTRRAKLTKELAISISPSKRGRGGRTRNERKITKSESETSPADVYEFRDESDEANKEQRPRLILTIKSPAVSNSNNSQTTAIIKEVTKDGSKEIGREPIKETHPSPIKSVDSKEEFTPPAAANTRKSRRLQEKDTSKNTVDDTIEDVVKNTGQKRAGSSQRRSARQAVPKQTPAPIEVPRKSPRCRKGRRGSEATETSSSEETLKEEVKQQPSPTKDVEKPKEIEKPLTTELKKAAEKPEELIDLNKGKPQEVLKTGILRCLKVKGGNINPNEPTNLIDPVTGELIPMRESEEGKYVPLPGSKESKDKVTETKESPPVVPAEKELVKPPKPLSLKAHVLSAQAAHAVVTQQPTPVKAKPVTGVPVPPPTASMSSKGPQIMAVAPMVVSKSIASHSVPKTTTPIIITKTVTPMVVSKPLTPVIMSKPVTPISQHLSINTSLGLGVVTSTNLSPRPNIPSSVALKPVPSLAKPPVVSPGMLSNQQKQQLLQVSKQQLQQQVNKSHLVSPMVNQAQMVNIQMAHVKHQPLMKQQVIMGKGAMVKHQQQILSGAVPSPPLSKSQPMMANPSRIIQGPLPVGSKGVMEPPKVEVSMSNVILGQRPKLSPQGPQQRLVGQTGLPVPGYEASLGEAIAHFPPGPLRPPPEISPAHYMHPSHVIQYQQFIRKQLLSRSGGVEKVGDGQEGEEAPVTSPPLELRRPGSVGIAMAGRGAAVPHSLHSPHDRATDSPQVGQVYNVHPTRLQHYHTPNRYHYEQTEPPPAHRPLTSHGSLAALGSDRGLAHMSPMGTPDRPLSGHSALTAHMGGLGTADRPISSHVERPLSTHGMMGAGLGAAGNLMGAVARHIGADAPTSQRGLQAATPPHASQVPPQAESLFMLLKQYPCMWQGLLALKNDQAAVQMYFVSGNDDVAKCSLPKNTDGSTPPLRIFQRMRLEPPQVEGVARKMQMENEHCMLLALPCGHDHMDVLKQSTNLTSGFITYLQQKQAAGIVNVAAPGTTQPPAYVVHIFPSCDFVNENLRRIAPSLLERVADIAHLLIVITTV
ncbi:hypothetical protein JTB14_018117 [Gonioctena quinquepunctata]|nr:hypothetical protein JTB14_018117 [Gonioctena quinquepunctata]